jgi:hypothetical protein
MQKYERIKKMSPIAFKRLTGGAEKHFHSDEFDHSISSERALNENVIGRLKRFKILTDKYRNRRKRFGLRFNLIAGIHNWEVKT